MNCFDVLITASATVTF